MAGINGGVLGPANTTTSGMFTLDEIPFGSRFGGAIKPGAEISVRALVVGAGGTQGGVVSGAYGGAGGGGFFDGTIKLKAGMEYGVTVGAPGNASKIYSITTTIKQCEPGGHGPSDHVVAAGSSGAPTSHPGGGPTPYANGGGGGAGQAGGAAGWPNIGGNGGDGLQSDITGVNTWYAGGSGGYGDKPAAGSPGQGGNNPGGGGHSGIVVVRYPGDHTKNSTVTNGTMTLVGGDTVWTFTTSGFFMIA